MAHEESNIDHKIPGSDNSDPSRPALKGQPQHQDSPRTRNHEQDKLHARDATPYDTQTKLGRLYVDIPIGGRERALPALIAFASLSPSIFPRNIDRRPTRCPCSDRRFRISGTGAPAADSRCRHRLPEFQSRRRSTKYCWLEPARIPGRKEPSKISSLARPSRLPRFAAIFPVFDAGTRCHP